jgi:hypothetical protein
VLTTTLTFTLAGPGPYFGCAATLTASAATTVIAGTVPTNAIINVTLTQAAGLYTVAAPTGFCSWAQPYLVSGAVSSASYQTSNAGTNWSSLNGGCLSYGQVPLSSAPGTPPTGYLFPWMNSTDLDAEWINSAGSIFAGFLKGADCNPVTGICTKTNGTAFTALATTAPGTNVAAFLATPSGTNFNSMIAAGGIPINCSGTCAKSAAYTTVLGDGGGMIIHAIGDNNARTFTIDSNANVAYPLYTVITFVNSINTVTIAITSDTLTLAGTASTGSRTLAVNGVATAVKVGTTSWIISGPGLT